MKEKSHGQNDKNKSSPNPKVEKTTKHLSFWGLWQEKLFLYYIYIYVYILVCD